MSLIKHLQDTLHLSTVRTAARHGDLSKLLNVLTQKPDLIPHIIKECRTAYSQGLMDDCLTYIIALVRCNAHDIQNILECLLAQKDKRLWSKLGTADAQRLAEYAFLVGGPALYEQTLCVYSDDLFEQVRPERDQDLFVRWIYQALHRDYFRREAVDRFVHERLLSSDTNEQASIDRLLDDCFNQMQDRFVESRSQCSRQEEEDIVQQIALLALACRKAPRHQVLDTMAQRLDRLHFYAVASAVDLITRMPDPLWIPKLKGVWLDRLEPIVRIGEKDRDYTSSQLPPQTELAAFSTLAALGACGAADGDYRNLEADRAKSAEYEQTIETCNKLMENHNRLLAELKDYPQVFSAEPGDSPFHGQGG